MLFVAAHCPTAVPTHVGVNRATPHRLRHVLCRPHPCGGEPSRKDRTCVMYSLYSHSLISSALT